MISTDNIYLLKAHETIYILFKFLTFREYYASINPIGERRINITFSQIHGQISHTLEIDIMPTTSWIVDYSRTFHESECRHIDIRLSSFIPEK
jgi:hypothetical protein